MERYLNSFDNPSFAPRGFGAYNVDMFGNFKSKHSISFADQAVSNFLFMTNSTFEQVKYSRVPGVMMVLEEVRQRLISSRKNGLFDLDELSFKVQPSVWLQDTLTADYDTSFATFEDKAMGSVFVGNEAPGSYTVASPADVFWTSEASEPVNVAWQVIESLSCREQEKQTLFAACVAVLNNDCTATYICPDAEWEEVESKVAVLREILGVHAALKITKASALPIVADGPGVIAK